MKTILAFSLLASIALCQNRQQSTMTNEYDLKNEKWAKAIFAGGCFWCMEPPYEKLPGVKAAISGYCGGKESAPQYKAVASGQTGHAESILVLYDPKEITYSQLVDVFWKNINPWQMNGQFYDMGPQYRTAIFYLDDEQKKIAEASKQALEKSKKFDKPIATEISAATGFWVAEEYHQDFYKKDPDHYKRYRIGSGRDAFIRKHWGD